MRASRFSMSGVSAERNKGEAMKIKLKNAKITFDDFDDEFDFDE